MLTNFSRAGIVAIVAGLPSLANAQIKDVAPYPAVIIADADLHAGDTAQFYRVGTAAKGIVVIVDGESANWSRISYPAGSYAFVPADDATYDAATKELKLSKASRLRAANPTSGFNGSWKALLITALPAGTSMKVDQVEDGGKGSGPIAYRVAAPADARAFTESKNLRKATPDEVSAFKAKGGKVADVANAAPASVPAAAPVKTSAPVAAAPTTPAPSAPAPKPEPAVDNSLVTPMKTDGTAGAPAAPAPSSPTTSTPSSTEPAPLKIDQSAAPAGTSPAAPATTAPSTPASTTPPPAPVITPSQRTTARIKELDQAFERVNSQPLGEAEYETLISEYERSINGLSGQLSPRQRSLLEQRLNILKFRKDLRQQQLALLNESSSEQQRNQQVLQKVSEVEASRVYSIIGQLQPSTVYNGQTLPLMFRIQSVGTSVPRTLGYIKPDPRFALDSKIGQVVGVIGETSMDKALNLNVITPVRIDLLQGVQIQPSQQPAVQIPAAPSGQQLPPVQLPEQQQPPKKAPIDINK